MTERRIGVYICHCGGNISDYVDVERVRAAIEHEAGVVVAKTAMFTCSDATQQEMAQDIADLDLNGLVVASCSPKLHTFTFRGVAKRADMNPYEYTQVNVREQCSWTHTDDHEGATQKAIRLVRAGIAHTRLSSPLEPTVVQTMPKALVIGGGIAGLRAAVALSDIGLGVFLVEKDSQVGGRVAGLGTMYPHNRNGHELIEQLKEQIRQRPDITLFTDAELIGKAGSFGNYQATIRMNKNGETVTIDVGSIIVATGFDSYQPAEGEYGYGIDGVVTLQDFKQLIDASNGPLVYRGKPVKDIAYIYCVGSRQSREVENCHTYCSRYCCNAAVHASMMVNTKGAKVHQYHLYRDMRTYGKYELLYRDARDEGSLFLKFADDAPPSVKRDATTGKLLVTVADQLTQGKELTLPVDMVVLVTGMVPRSNEELIKTLKLPVGRDGFFNEIHPKLRPVETVVDGVYIAGACQGPKNSSEAVGSALAAVTQSASILKKGFAELEPLVATVNPVACTWCDKCIASCPYEGAIGKAQVNGRDVATINQAVCKGCGGCVPVCDQNAIDLQGYTDAQIRAMIDSLAKEVVS